MSDCKKQSGGTGAVAALFLVVMALLACGGPAPGDQDLGDSPSGGPPSAWQRDLDESFKLYQAGQYEAAIDAAQAALAANPNSAPAYNNMAVSYLALGKFDEAIQAAQQAIRVQPEFQLAKNNLAWIQQEKAKASGQPVAAAQPAQPTAPPSGEGSLLDQSWQHFQAGRYQECVDAASRVARASPESARAFTNIGICLAGMKRWDDAIRNTQEAVRLDPSLQLARNNLGWMLAEKAKAGAPR